MVCRLVLCVVMAVVLFGEQDPVVCLARVLLLLLAAMLCAAIFIIQEVL